MHLSKYVDGSHVSKDSQIGLHPSGLDGQHGVPTLRNVAGKVLPAGPLHMTRLPAIPSLVVRRRLSRRPWITDRFVTGFGGHCEDVTSRPVLAYADNESL